MNRIGGILLAAGLSDRMQGPNKMLLPYGNSSVIGTTYQALAQSRLLKTVIVTGRDAAQVQDQILLQGDDQIVQNELFTSGMTSSIQVGLNELKPFEAVMVCLGDMPLLTSQDYNLLINTFEQKCDAHNILVPWFQDHRANPVIFGSDYFDDILNHAEPNGCSGIIKQNAEKVLNLNVDNERFITDLDTPNDYEKLNKN
ncbi:nucleotidyltransferase family protein [Roseivirga sp.]|uniref:nucleotidyltransferase family protein n=1 Tax=Roseivirga sp. TaxID=1964215 RepID=UPI003B8E685B